MLESITLIPGFMCIFVLLRSGTRSAFLNVFLPVLLLLPSNFYLQITHLPNLAFVDVTLLALGAGLVVMDFSRWQPSWMDACVLVFIFSCGYSEWLHYAAWRAGALAVMEGLVPYMAAKLLLGEPTMAVETGRRFPLLVAGAMIFGMYEFVFKRNPYSYVVSHFYRGQWGGSATQIRWGFGRVAGPYTQSELAGTMVMAALLLGIWAARWYGKDAKLRLPGTLPIAHAGLVLAIVAAALYTTQARGPWLGALVAVAVASIGRAVRPVRRALILLALGVVVGIPLYQMGKEYTSGPRTDYGSEKETAQYRAELADNYIPLAESGGAWGLGRMVPIVRGQVSIDNEYLFLWLVQGSVGLGSFLVILVGTAVALVRVGLKTRTWRDRQLVFTLLGILLGMAFVISTVWLGAQTFELLFLLVGWAQVIRPNATEDAAEGLEQDSVVRRLVEQSEGSRVYT